MMYMFQDPIADANAYYADERTPIGCCEGCGHDVFKADECSFEDDKPMLIERLYFHERCVMPYARNHWSLN